MIEKGTTRRPEGRVTSPLINGRRARAGSTTKRTKFRRALRSLNSQGFHVGRKLILSEDGRHIAIAFENYIRAKRDHSRRLGEVTHEQFWQLIALHKSESAI